MVIKGIDLGWVLALPSLVAWPSFCPLVAKFVKMWSRGFGAILVGNCHKCIQNEVSKFWLQKELICVGFWLTQVGWNDFFCLGSKIGKKWSHGYWAILVGNLLGLIVSKFKRWVNWAFKSFSQSQYLSQYTENKSIYLEMYRFILALFMFETVYISQVNHEIMQIDFPNTHTLILGVYY